MFSDSLVIMELKYLILNLIYKVSFTGGPQFCPS